MQGFQILTISKTKEWLFVFALVVIAGYVLQMHFVKPQPQLEFALLGIPLVFLILWKPIVGIIAYIFYYPTISQSGALNLPKIGMFALTLLLLASWFVRKATVSHQPSAISHQQSNVPLFLFFGFLPFSLLLGGSYDFTPVDWARDIAALLNLILIPVCKDLIDSEKKLKIVLSLFIAGSIWVLLVPINWILPSFGLPAIPYLGKILSFWRVGGSTLHTPFVFGLGVCLAVYDKKRRWLWVCVCGIALLNALWTQTRTVWFAMFVEIALLFLFLGKERWKFTLLFGFLALGVLFLLFERGEESGFLDMQRRRAKSILEFQYDISVENRIEENKKCFELFASSPVYGVGFGYQYEFLSKKGALTEQIEGNFTHSDLTFILSKGGIIGLVLFLGMFYSLLRGVKTISNFRFPISNSQFYHAFSISVFIGLITSLIVGLSTPVFQTRPACFLIGVAVGIVFAIPRKHGPRKHESTDHENTKARTTKTRKHGPRKHEK